MNDAMRVDTLRARCLARRRTDSLQRHYLPLSERGFRLSEGEPWHVRRAFVTRERMVGSPLALGDAELLMGRLAPPEEVFTPEEEDAARAYLEQFPGAPGMTGHCELDVSRLLAEGVDGLAADIAARRDAAEGMARDEYRAFLLALEGLTGLAENAAQTAEAALADADDARRDELRAMADSCRRIAHAPAETFRDALQLKWFAELGVMQGDRVGLVVPGHLDRTLWPYYERDRAAERLTADEALRLIESLYLLINEFVPPGLAMSAMVGGRDAEGRDVTNALSFLCLEALRRTNLVYPTVGICWHEGTPDALTNLAVDLIGRGYTTPAFFCDETIQRGLTRYGAPPEQACNYINSTCVEITPSGASNVWVASRYYPLCLFLVEEIARMAHGEAAPATFEDFFADFEKRLAREIAGAVEEQNALRRQRAAFGGKALQSVLTRDCIGRGRNLDDGGALYNWVECSFVGIANLADSLHVIRREVYAERNLTLAELHAILEADFEGHEAERQRFLHHHAKYGNGAPEVDALVSRIADVVELECATYRVEPDESPYIPGTFCWVMHERLGRECGATPDGRRAGFPFADGGGPAQGRERHGPTAAILSTTSWDHAPMMGGLAYNMKFPKSLFVGGDGFDRLRDLILTYLRRGGLETQVNVVDHATLKKAREHPEAYADLVVRIGGYTDYFTRLTPGMQDEIMMRAEFGER